MVQFTPEQQIAAEGVTPGSFRAGKLVSKGTALLPWSPCTCIFLAHQGFQEDGGEMRSPGQPGLLLPPTSAKLSRLQPKQWPLNQTPVARIPLPSPGASPSVPILTPEPAEPPGWRPALLGAAEVGWRAALGLGSVSLLPRKATAQPLLPLIIGMMKSASPLQGAAAEQVGLVPRGTSLAAGHQHGAHHQLLPGQL